MQWLNEPASWQRVGDVLTVTVDPGTDFWRETGYGYVHDNGHVYGEVFPGDLDVTVSVRGSYATQYDQAGIMLRADDRTWVKAGVEFFEGRPRLSTVLTLGRSSWTVTDLPERLDEITLRASRRGDAVEIRYTVGEGPSELAALVFLPPDREVLAGVMCAAPEGTGFRVTFSDLSVTEGQWAGGWEYEPQQAWAAAGEAALGTGDGQYAGDDQYAGDEQYAGAEYPGPEYAGGYAPGYPTQAEYPAEAGYPPADGPAGEELPVSGADDASEPPAAEVPEASGPPGDRAERAGEARAGEVSPRGAGDGEAGGTGAGPEGGDEPGAAPARPAADWDRLATGAPVRHWVVPDDGNLGDRWPGPPLASSTDDEPAGAQPALAGLAADGDTGTGGQAWHDGPPDGRDPAPAPGGAPPEEPPVAAAPGTPAAGTAGEDGTAADGTAEGTAGEDGAADGVRAQDAADTTAPDAAVPDDDRTEPELPAAQATDTLTGILRRLALKSPGDGVPAPPDPADEWISLLTADPADD